MKTYIAAGILLMALASPALADYYVALDLTTGACLIMNTQPTDTNTTRAWGSTVLRPKLRRLLHLAGGAIGQQSIAE
jgi:hypothetical protein